MYRNEKTSLNTLNQKRKGTLSGLQPSISEQERLLIADALWVWRTSRSKTIDNAKKQVEKKLLVTILDETSASDLYKACLLDAGTPYSPEPLVPYI